MKFNDLDLTRTKKTTRVGRGISAGRGKTAGRGTKGQGARKSGGVRPGFEGGQMPLYMRIPKLRGFKSHRPKKVEVFTSDLEKLGKSKVDTAVLAAAGLIESPHVAVKLISKGKITIKVDVELQAASSGAQQAIKKNGGSFKKVPRVKRPKTTAKSKK